MVLHFVVTVRIERARDSELMQIILSYISMNSMYIYIHTEPTWAVTSVKERGALKRHPLH